MAGFWQKLLTTVQNFTKTMSAQQEAPVSSGGVPTELLNDPTQKTDRPMSDAELDALKEEMKASSKKLGITSQVGLTDDVRKQMLGAVKNMEANLALSKELGIHSMDASVLRSQAERDGVDIDPKDKKGWVNYMKDKVAQEKAMATENVLQ